LIPPAAAKRASTFCQRRTELAHVERVDVCVDTTDRGHASWDFQQAPSRSTGYETVMV